MTLPRHLCPILTVLAFAACEGSSKETPSVPVRPAAAPARVADSAAPVAEPCPPTGKWEVCSLEKRLRQSGFVARKLDEEPSARTGFSVKPMLYSLGRSRLEVFLYDDEASLGRDVAALDTIAVAPHGQAGTWPGTPVFIRNANLAAVLLTESGVQAERLMLAITAGAPQP